MKNDLVLYQSTAGTLSVPAEDEDGTALDLTGQTLRFVAFDRNNSVVFEIQNAAIRATPGRVEVDYTTTHTATAGDYRYVLRVVSPAKVVLGSRLTILVAPTGAG